MTVTAERISKRKVFISSIATSIHMRLTDCKNPPKGLSVFHSIDAPNISICKYLQRILKYAEFPLDFLIVSLIYIDRFLQMNPSYGLGELNVHRILISRGITLRELNHLEKEFLQRIGYQLYIEPEVYSRYVNENHYIQKKLIGNRS